MLFKRKPNQAQSISGANISGAQVQQGQAEENLTQTQQDNQANKRSRVRGCWACKAISLKVSGVCCHCSK
jgi:hypothetical protein